MTEQELAAANAGKTSAPKTDKKNKNTKSVSLTADELRQQTSEQIGALAGSVSTPMMAVIKKTASQKIMLETVQSMPGILADANAGLEDFFDSFEPETLAFDLTMNQLPQSAQLQLKAA
jgi:hypothetical protein